MITMWISKRYITLKKDRFPNGTAIHLAEDIIKNMRKKLWTIGDITNQPQRTIHIESIRQDQITGTHMIHYASTLMKLPFHDAKSEWDLRWAP